MSISLRRLLAPAFSFLFIAGILQAQEPWEGAPFASDPAALVAAAQKISPGEEGVVILLDESVYTFQADGSTRSTWRFVYHVVTESAVAPNAQVEADWAPWYHSRPVIEARVVTKGGTVHTLDAAAVTEAPAPSALDIFSDSRILRAPLPAVEVGAVVEYVITVDGRSPIRGAGSSFLVGLARQVPAHRTRVIVDAPLELEPRIVNKSGLTPSVEEKDGRRRTTFVRERTEPFEDLESYLPFDDADYPYLAFSTGRDWQEIAVEYSKIVDQQIAGSDLQKMVRAAIGPARDRQEMVSRALAAIQKDIRYAGVEVGEASIVPRPPSIVLRNKYGDCKDKATLLVAMLRTAGLTAHVALLRAGTDLDVHPELPGLGLFNHAIVRVDGFAGKDEPVEPIWVDPTDEFAKAGELPFQDQGRMALLAAPGTTALIKTPESPSTANRYVETRTFHLPEDGKARVVEVTETAGVEDSSQRRYCADSDKKSYRESMESYVQSYYFAKELGEMDVTDPHDFGTPFRLKLEAIDSGSGIVNEGEAAVAIHPGALFNTLPTILRDWSEPQPDDDPEDLPKKRVHDFVFPVPKVKEWTYRIVPPTGYTVRALPKNESRKLGTVTYSAEYSMEPDGVVVAKLRADSGNRRLTAAEFEETRIALSKLIREPQIDIGFDLKGQALLNAGDVGGALAEFRRLAALHPKEAQHHMEIARALLAGGLGEAAREAARRAVAIEPKSVAAHRMLASTLQHDLLGRRNRKGSDIAGAIAELRKARELDPEDLDVRVRLARILTYGEDGVQYGRKARLDDAIAEYRALAEDLGEDGKAYDGELMLALAHAGRFKELQELSATTEDKQRRALGRILALAAMEGAEAAVRELSAFDVDTRRSYAGMVAQYLLALRLYPQTAAMLDVSLQGTPQASQSALYLASVRKTRRLEEMPARPDDPADVVRAMFLALVRGDEKALFDLTPKDLHERMRKELEEEGSDPFSFLNASAEDESMPVGVMADLVQSMIQIQKEGNDETGYRVRLRISLDVEDSDFVLFVTREGGRYLIRASDDDESVGFAALHFLENGQVETARIWLNWARESVDLGGGDDPLAGSPFAALWPRGKATATAEEVRLAAAAYVAEHKDETVKTLEELRGKAGTEELKSTIDRALVRAYGNGEHWQKMAEAGRRLSEKYPDSGTAFIALTTGLSASGKAAEAQLLAKQRLERLPRDREAMRALAHAAAAAGDFAAAEKVAQQIVDEIRPERADFNNAAWYGLMTGNLERATENARQATAGESGKEAAASFHTLAAIYAEAGKAIEAREALLSSMDKRNRDQPGSDDWYVLGRIAESYGVRDAAVAAYKRVEKDDSPGGTVWQLTARRLQQIK